LNWIYIMATVATIVSLPSVASPQTIESLSLDGSWEVSIDDRQSWSIVVVPGTIEDQIADEFDGVSVYRKKFQWPSGVKENERLFLRFEAVATKATVMLNGVVVGSHLGGWTPFELDITDHLRETNRMNELEVVCDELVGHNTQGFLPVFSPHFGGIWKSVSVEKVPHISVDPGRVGVQFDFDGKCLHVEIPFRELPVHDRPVVKLFWRKLGTAKWIPLATAIGKDTNGAAETETLTPITYQRDGDRIHISIPLDKRKPDVNPRYEFWSPAAPHLYEMKITLPPDRAAVEPLKQHCIVRFGLRDFRTAESRLLLNGQPINLRGLLNWGYCPPGIGPTTNEEMMRKEIQLAQSYGFNLMKFCLWIPPKRYLELCDELGMLAWIEYPAWHPEFSKEKLPSLTREYDEFFEYDRIHPSVILRSLTCETGPSADLAVLEELTRLCKVRIPGAVVEDDSSWIEWNRVHDFYDDHPYGNNHTWVDQLQELKQYIARRKSKPLLLGEAIAADTWCDPEPILDRVKDERPFWVPGFLDGNQQWLQQIKGRASKASLQQLFPDSLRYAMLMRKFQIEIFRRDVPNGGYVVSVVRDIPFCSMGLVDFLNRPKFEPSEWNWHDDIMLCLETDNEQRSFFGNQALRFRLHVRGRNSENLTRAECYVRIKMGDSESEVTGLERRKAIGIGESSLPFEFKLPTVSQPTQAVLLATLRDSTPGHARKEPILTQNAWPIWIVPTDNLEKDISIVRHASMEQLSMTTADGVNSEDSILVTHVLDADVVDHVRHGGQAVLIPNDRPGSLPLKPHWFLRGGPLVDSDWIFPEIPRAFFVDLQHFDLAGNVVPEIQSYLASIDPILVLWDNHDIKHVNTHGLIYRIGFASGGSIMVTAVDHKRSPAGKYLFAELLNSLARPEKLTRSPGGDELLGRLERELHSRTIRLDQLDWKFQADPEHDGQSRSFQTKSFDDSFWQDIRTDRHWESQGHEKLDGWAWYRIKVDVPDDWPDDRVFLNFTGVDDHYRLYVDGNYVGQSGDIENRQTAFDERKSYEIARFVKPGRSVQIAIEVYDWYGAGGIFRPVTLTTEPLSDMPRILK
jgi:hypothetical protein